MDLPAVVLADPLDIQVDDVEEPDFSEIRELSKGKGMAKDEPREGKGKEMAKGR